MSLEWKCLSQRLYKIGNRCLQCKSGRWYGFIWQIVSRELWIEKIFFIPTFLSNVHCPLSIIVILCPTFSPGYLLTSSRQCADFLHCPLIGRIRRILLVNPVRWLWLLEKWQLEWNKSLLFSLYFVISFIKQMSEWFQNLKA